ncbi:MAG: hypothetical protein IIC21_04740 [Chloroflexi bacterium]|nr:hypothetical protein [Chloroflexota bacterium]
MKSAADFVGLARQLAPLEIVALFGRKRPILGELVADALVDAAADKLVDKAPALTAEGIDKLVELAQEYGVADELGMS